MSTLIEHRDSAATPTRARTERAEFHLYLFLLVQFACQSALMAERFAGNGRTALRVTAFASSLLMLILIPGRSAHAHPARLSALATLALMSLGLLHPTANHLSGIAHWVLNIAIWAPLFWIGRVSISSRTLGNTLLLLWLFNLAGSLVGVLQVYYPERFAPSAEFVRSISGTSADGLLIERADGKQVWRPFGLSDTPGGAAISGSFTVLMGAFLVLSKSGTALRMLAAAGIFAGGFCLYVCELRSLMVVTVVGVIVLIVLQLLQGRVTRTLAALLMLPIFVFVAFAWTRSVGTERIENRMRTLAEDSMATVYYKNRGHFVTYTITDELPKYPLGAGLGRYGMMYRYFGDKRSSNSSAMYVEVQITAWLYDGGLPLVLLAYFALVMAGYTTFRIAVSKRVSPLIADYASVITALNAGWIAATFSSALFEGPTGMVFWLLNGAVYSAASWDAARLTRQSPSHGSAEVKRGIRRQLLSETRPQTALSRTDKSSR
ncbi:MAG: hypothetical protein C0483_16340 [Pirellula sp.]|nr:hypothetical protein [Pirellula sp.]